MAGEQLAKCIGLAGGWKTDTPSNAELNQITNEAKVELVAFRELLEAALSEQEGMGPCGKHSQGEWVERSTDLQPMLLLTGEPEQLVTDGYCRSCKQQAEAVRDADEKWLYEMCAIDLTPPRDKPIDRKGFVRWLIDSVTYNNVDLFAVETAVEVMQAEAVRQERIDAYRDVFQQVVIGIPSLEPIGDRLLRWIAELEAVKESGR